jgi:hypothetical protein
VKDDLALVETMAACHRRQIVQLIGVQRGKEWDARQKLRMLAQCGLRVGRDEWLSLPASGM